MRIFRRVGRVWWVVLGFLVVIVSVGLWWVLMTRAPSKEEVMVEVAKAQASAEAVAAQLNIELSEWELTQMECTFGGVSEQLSSEGVLDGVPAEETVLRIEEAVLGLGGELTDRRDRDDSIWVYARWQSGSRYGVAIEVSRNGEIRFSYSSDCHDDTTPDSATTP